MLNSHNQKGKMAHIVIAGGSGFVGTYLSSELVKKGYEVHIVSRSKHQPKRDGIQFVSYDSLDEVMNGAKAVINLAGFNLFDTRWTTEIKQKIVSSRVKTTQSIVDSISKATIKPDVFISASAVGYYGNRGNEFLREDSFSGEDFLSDVCKQWEETALNAKDIRIVIPRIGIVLEQNGGALGKMLTPFKYFVGGPLGNGKQYFPWVHMNDVVFSIIESITNEEFSGVYNCVAPQELTMGDFASVLGDVLHRPSLFSVPEFVLNLALGEASGALVASQRVIPQKLKDWNYSFKYTDLKTALKEMLD